MRTLIIIPAYNEAESIGGVISDIKRNHPGAEILVINDGSTDDTGQKAEQTNSASVINLPYNLGIGGAIQTGFKYAKRENYQLVVRMDGDGQHLAESITKIKEPVLKGEADIVIGSRFLNEMRPTSTPIRKIAQRLISFLISALLRQKITDVFSGFRCYNQKAIAILSKYYPLDYPEPEEIIFLKKNKFRIKEVGVLMKEREMGSSSLNYLYFALKVTLSIFISFLRTPTIKK